MSCTGSARAGVASFHDGTLLENETREENQQQLINIISSPQDRVSALYIQRKYFLFKQLFIVEAREELATTTNKADKT